MNLQTAALRPVACLALVATLFAGTLSSVSAAPPHRELHANGYRVKTVVKLSGYTNARAIRLSSSGAIAGDAVLGSRRCLLAKGGALLDVTPPGWSTCWVNAMASNGAVAGRVTSGEKSEGFVYRAGRAYVIPSALSFSELNDSGLALGVKEDGSTGVYDAESASWQVFADLGRGCAIVQPIALNDHFVFGAATCSDGVQKYALADAGHFLSLTLPKDLQPSSVLTSADQLVLFDPRSGGHAYLWRVFGTRPPIDLGEAPGYQYGTYTPVAGNGQGDVVGENPPQFFAWVRTPVDGMRDLDAIIPQGQYFGLTVADVDESGNVLAQAFDFATGAQVWLVLQPV